jgi:CrcB protein
MNLFLFIAAAAFGGFTRSTVEYYLPPVGSSAFPRATLLVNILGSFVLGISLALPGHWYLIVGTGFCGALTTFSGVSLQLHRRLTAEGYKPALIYLGALLSLGIFAAGAGLLLGQKLFS